MPILCIEGLPGHGKTYEATHYVMLPAFIAGRRCVTNIRGISREGFVSAAQRKKASSSSFGEFVVVSADDVRQPSFFPDPENEHASSFVKSGDLVVLDEAGALFGKNKDLSDRDIRFFTQHRHFDDPVSGVGIEIVLIVQDVSLIAPKLRSLIENLLVVARHKWAGRLGRFRYHVSAYSGSMARGKPVSTYQHKIDPSAPPLYKSTRGGSTSETEADSRFSSIGKKKIIFLGALCMIGPLSFIFAYSRVHTIFGSAAPEKSSSPAVSAAPLSHVVSSVPPPPHQSAVWRLAGFVRSPLRSVAVLVSSAGETRFVDLWHFEKGSLGPLGGVVDGELVAEYSSPSASSGLPISAGVK